MIRNFKALGLALVALFAMGAVIASSASAATFHSEKEATILTGINEGNHVFGTTNGSFSVECGTAVFRGTSLGESKTTTTKTVEVHPTYENCTSSLGNAPVDTTGCNYVFLSETTASKHLRVEIECTNSFAIKVTAPGCTLSFSTQLTSGGISIKNEGAGTTRDTTSTSTTIASFTKSGIGCFAVEGTDGTYKGATTLKGWEDKGVTGNIDEGATYTEGPQVGIWWE